jgi:DNA mismatch repair protein MutS
MPREIVPEPRLLLNKGGVVADGINETLDELRAISYNGKDYLLQIQQRESERTAIPSLKIAYNSVFGYYIEVRNTYKDNVPPEWIRKQTLVNAERYITQELKEYEEKILGAEEKIMALETQIYNNLVCDLAAYIPAIQVDAVQLARLDVLLSFAEISKAYKYMRPIISEDDVLDIKKGRHPVIERNMPVGEEYVPNDLYLDTEKQQIIIVTGPNMAGKSALLRQTALITLLAQIGCFVPADSAQIGIVDKIFTRVGASDNISAGESTFMVEMTEAANILNNLSGRSLVLFDELGRGTSTYDGMSIAWAIVEFIHEYSRGRARTLFATHYHELNEMEKSFARIKNFNVSVHEKDGRVIFLRKLMPGGSEHSFGIHVAKLAGMPKSIVKRSEQILAQLESSNGKGEIKGVAGDIADTREGMQLNFFQLDDPILSQIRDEILNIDVNNLTPLEALNKLSEIKKIVKGK